ncbi:hypothetical protein BDV3_002646 [Batrachochytrium dendrobatidis]
MNTLSCLLDFTRLQGDRAQVYSGLERGFDLFISGQASRQDFVVLANSARDSFVLISKQARLLERFARLRDCTKRNSQGNQ